MNIKNLTAEEAAIAASQWEAEAKMIHDTVKAAEGVASTWLIDHLLKKAWYFEETARQCRELYSWLTPPEPGDKL